MNIMMLHIGIFSLSITCFFAGIHMFFYGICKMFKLEADVLDVFLFMLSIPMLILTGCLSWVSFNNLIGG